MSFLGTVDGWFSGGPGEEATRHRPDQPLSRLEIRNGIHAHWADCSWPAERWPNFTAKELACPHCGELYIDRASIDLIQRARTSFGPLRINSAHRCIIHNVHVGGAPMSQHKKIAFDVSVRGLDRFAVLRALQGAGFTTFGLYQTFIHTDIRPGRRWYSGPRTCAFNGATK